MPSKWLSTSYYVLRFVVLMALLMLSCFGYYLLTPLNTGGAWPRSITIETGASMTIIAQQLAQQGLIEQPKLFIWSARLLGYANTLRAGSYELQQALSPLALLQYLSRGNMRLAAITFIEGWQWRQIRQAINNHPDLRHDSQQWDDMRLMAWLGSPDLSPEGMFFPDTYYFAKGSSDLWVLKRAYQLMQQRLAQAWAMRQQAQSPLQTPYELLILASIVEKETAVEADRPLVAAVLTNRLRKGMRLQADPTVIYGMGERYQGNLRRIDLQTDTPYNTYTRVGLTPTPIAMPGNAALFATINPASSKALYFVAKGDGSSYFSERLHEHNRAVRRYQLGD